MRKFELKENYPDILRETETATGIKKCNRVEINQQLGDSWAKQKDIDGLYKNQNKMQSLHHSPRLHQVLRQKEVIFDQWTFFDHPHQYCNIAIVLFFTWASFFTPILTIYDHLISDAPSTKQLNRKEQSVDDSAYNQKLLNSIVKGASDFKCKHCQEPFGKLDDLTRHMYQKE